jgi:hypothetical protein
MRVIYYGELCLGERIWRDVLQQEAEDILEEREEIQHNQNDSGDMHERVIAHHVEDSASLL